MPRMPTAPTEKILGTMLVEMRDTFTTKNFLRSKSIVSSFEKMRLILKTQQAGDQSPYRMNVIIIIFFFFFFFFLICIAPITEKKNVGATVKKINNKNYYKT